MKEKEVVEENEEEEEGISKFCYIHPDIHTDTVQYENREHPPGAPCWPRPLGAQGLGSICAWLGETGIMCNHNLNQVKDKCKTFLMMI